jgi:hypothetical protein
VLPEKEQRTMPPERFETLKQCVGYRVRGPRGRKIGKVKTLFLNESGGPEYAEIRMGLFGLKRILLPIQSVIADTERRSLVLQ